jgi:hypothetical protein
VQFPEKQEAGAWAALIAIVGPSSVAIIETVAILAAAEWARPVLVLEEPSVDPELWQNFPPTMPRALDRIVAHHHDRDANDLA